MEEKDQYTSERVRMVDEQLAARDIRDERVLQAFRKVPRHRFVPTESRHLAYADAYRAKPDDLPAIHRCFDVTTLGIRR